MSPEGEVSKLAQDPDDEDQSPSEPDVSEVEGGDYSADSDADSPDETYGQG